MSLPLTADDVDRFSTFLEASLAQAAPEAGRRELCARVMEVLRARTAPSEEALGEADFRFLNSWLKARDLIVGGLQFLEMADEGNADSIRHERECTETAFTLLPRLIAQARQGD